MLINLNIGDSFRQTAIRASAGGFLYVWDRATGELLIEPWMHVYTDVIRGVNMETGRAIYDIDKWTFTHVEDRRRYTQIDPLRDALGANLPDNYTGTEVSYCPGTSARNWQNDAYSPRTGLLYYVFNTSCSRFRMIEGEYTPGQGWTLQQGAGTATRTWFAGATITWQSGIHAVNPLFNQDGAYQWPAHPGTNAIAWMRQFEDLTDAPIMATATDLLFTGDTTTGRFLALDARTGETVWAFRTGNRFYSSPVSYIGPNGVQYIATIGSGRQLRDTDKAANWLRAGSNLYVFFCPNVLLQFICQRAAN